MRKIWYFFLVFRVLCAGQEKFYFKLSFRYEFCYGKRVLQYHEEQGKDRVEVLLGTYDEKLHKEWVKQHPNKVIKREDERITQVSNLYTAGGIF